MTEFTIRYHKCNQELGECEIKVPNDTAIELINHFKNFFEIELLQGQIQKESEKTLIKFQAARQKIITLEKIIKTALGITARLN